jgi:L-2-hydroxyglutarate oxidase LhgO
MGAVPEGFHVALVGGGIVALATARALSERAPRARLVLLEKEAELGRHQTTHNSGVIHAGIYYRPGSAKARLCVEGARLMAEFCDAHAIAVARRGKVIVATRPEEVERLRALWERGVANGVPGLRRLDAAGLREIEPYAAGLEAIHSPATATVDFGAVAAALARELTARGVRLETRARVVAVSRRGQAWVVQTPRLEVETRALINCAGLYADRVALLAGARPDVRIIPFRGEYYFLRPERGHLVRGLIYPVPDPQFPFLGVHFTRTVHGRVEAGPNAVLAFAREGYRLTTVRGRELWWTLSYPGFWAMVRRYWRTGGYELYRSLWRGAFVRALQRLVPAVRSADLIPGGSGVRAQAVARDGTLVDDFRIVETPGALHVLNAPSPAATASLAIGRYLAARAAALFDLT